MLDNNPDMISDALDKYAVSTVNRALTSEANKLEIFDLTHKLKQPGVYDIGGTYSEGDAEIKSDLWFFFSTTRCPGNNYLLNLFVCHRTPGTFSIGVGKIARPKMGVAMKHTSHDEFAWHMFRSTHPDENYHLHTYCFSELAYENIRVKESVIIDLKIEMNSMHTLNNLLVSKIKLLHSFAAVLAKQEKTDCVLISANQTRFPAHKVFLASHSSELREVIMNKKATENCEIFLDMNDIEVELLLEFIYSGTIKNLQNYDPFLLLQLADQFKLENLLFLTQYALGQQINVENAVMLAQISEQYNLEGLQSNVFNFIKHNPKVLETDGWKNLDDVNLAKKLFQHMHREKTD